MAASPGFSPENVHLTYTEIADLCFPEEKKRLGGLAIASDEPLGAMAWSPGEHGEPDLAIPRADRNQLLMHVNHIGGIDEMKADLAKVASYVALHENLRERGHIIGFTYQQLANVAVRGFGFRPVKPVIPDEQYVERIKQYYEQLKIAQRRPFKLAGVQMPVDEFIERYAIKRLGRDPQVLMSMVAWKAYSSERGEGDDPTLSALRNVIESMGGGSDDA